MIGRISDENLAARVKSEFLLTIAATVKPARRGEIGRLLTGVISVNRRSKAAR